MANTLMDRPGPPASSGSSSSGSTAGGTNNPVGRGGDERPGALGDVGTRARETLDEARQQATGLAGRVKDEGMAALSQQKDGAAEQVTGVADALRSTADDLAHSNPQVGQFVSFAAERLEGFGQQLRNRDLDTLINDATRWGRQSPVALFAGSLAVGFLLSRFLKSSASTPRSSDMPGTSGTSSTSGRSAKRRSHASGAHDWSWSGEDEHGSTASSSSGGAMTDSAKMAGSMGGSTGGSMRGSGTTGTPGGAAGSSGSTSSSTAADSAESTSRGSTDKAASGNKGGSSGTTNPGRAS